jgi:hypothetical protein
MAWVAIVVFVAEAGMSGLLAVGRLGEQEIMHFQNVNECSEH